MGSHYLNKKNLNKKNESKIRIRSMNRKTLALHVLENGQVEVRTPKFCPTWMIENFINEHQEWIAKHTAQAAKRYADRLTHFYFLGQEVTGSVLAGSHKVDFNMQNGQLDIFNPEASVEVAQKQWTEYKRKQAKQFLPSRVAELYHLFYRKLNKSLEYSEQSGLPERAPNVKIRSMKTRWGSCSSHGHINLALELMNQPIGFIDHVIIHELCHLIEFNHSKRFYRLMDIVMPDWKQKETEQIRI